LGVLNTLFTRALRISDNDHLESEQEHLRNVFLSNGYNLTQINKALERATKTQENKPKASSKEKKVGEHKAFLPYIQGTTDKIAKHLKKKNIDSVFSPPNNIRKLLRSVKDPVDPSLKKGVYLIPCECGKAYIGETGRSIRTRVKEHCADIRLNRTHKSALAEHSHNTKHPIKVEDMQVLAQVDNWSRRRIREAIEIVKNPKCLNRDDGLSISRSWFPNLTKLNKN